MAEDYRLDLLSKAIEKSGLDGATKDVLADDLRMAQKLGDSQMEQGIKRLLISGIRSELLTHDRISKAIEEHVDEWHNLSKGGVFRKAIISVGLQVPILAIVVYVLIKLAGIKVAGLFASGG